MSYSGRSRFEAGLPVSELWGKAQKDRKHKVVNEAGTSRWIVVDRRTGKEVREWGAGKRTRDHK